MEGHEIASDVDLQNLTAGWIPTDSNKYTVTIGPYKTDRKHYGTKKVVVYGVRPSYNNLMVYRRYLIVDIKPNLKWGIIDIWEDIIRF